MKESMLRKLVLLFLFSTIVCLLWAAGANSRKKVELEKSKQLNARLEKLTLANTVITDNLKQIQNKIAELKQKEYELKQNLEKQHLEKQELKDKIDITSKNEQELEALKKANQALGEELLRLKEQDISLRQELESVKSVKIKEETVQEQPVAEEKAEKSKGNFAW